MREAVTYPADGGFVGRPDFLALGRVAVGEHTDDGIFIGAWRDSEDSECDLREE